MSIESVISQLSEAIRIGKPCPPVRTLLAPGDIDAAYDAQIRVNDARVAAGGHIIGKKIGLTSRVVQEQLGVDQPDFGTLFADMVYHDEEPIALEGFMQPRIEAEVAFVLGRDIDNPVPSVVDVIRATEFVLPALEIVDSRIADWDISIVDTIADNASCGAVVLGTVPHALEGLNLPSLGMSLEHRGEVVSTGAGRACLGSPTIAVAWLARELQRRDTPLSAGDVILSGALGPMVPVSGGGSFRADLGQLGTVTAVFSEGM